MSLIFDAELYRMVACRLLFAVRVNDLLNKHEHLFMILLFESLPGVGSPFFFTVI